MDPRQSYPDEPDQRWYERDRAYTADSDWERRDGFGGGSEQQHTDEGYRMPEPRYADLPESGRYETARTGAFGSDLPTVEDSETPRASLGARSGMELPPDERVQHFHTEPIDRTALHRPTPPPAAPIPAPMTVKGGAVYRTRRAGVAVVLSFGLVILEVPALRVFLWAFGKVAYGAVVSSTLLVIGLPIFTLGLYGLLTGAASAAASQGGRAWLRSPLAYVPVGVALLAAAAVAAR